MELQQTDSAWFQIPENLRKAAVPGLEPFGPDLVPAWRDLKNVNNLCDRCLAIPWHLYQFEQQHVGDPARRYFTTTGSSGSNSFDKSLSTLHDHLDNHQWRNPAEPREGSHELPRLDRRDNDSASSRCSSPEPHLVGKLHEEQTPDEMLPSSFRNQIRSLTNDGIPALSPLMGSALSESPSRDLHRLRKTHAGVKTSAVTLPFTWREITQLVENTKKTPSLVEPDNIGLFAELSLHPQPEAKTERTIA
jgi:hypothetical protein